MVNANVRVGDYTVGSEHPLLLIAGPCVMESESMVLQVAEHLASLKQQHGWQIVFKSSFDKANRTSVDSYRGPGLDDGLKLLDKVKSATGLPTTTDIVTMPDRTDGPVPRDKMFQQCGSMRPSLSPYNFTSTGRWLPGADFSNGWPFAAYSSTMYNHVAPPNWSGYDCGTYSSIPDTPGEHAIISARSSHSGIVNVTFGDAHVETIADGIDLAVWRSMGSRNGQERIENADAR